VDAPTYTTLAAELRHEIDKVKGSRFIATACPVATPEEADAFVERVRREFHDARHTCWAYRLGRGGETWRFQDDGEPSGSAGRPILQQIEGHDLTDVVIAVTRYFGGTKLGIGGLVRAYGAAARECLERARTRVVVLTRRIIVSHPYECSDGVQALLAARGLRAISGEYGESVRFEVDVPEGEVEGFLSELRDRTAGRASGEVA